MNHSEHLPEPDPSIRRLPRPQHEGSAHSYDGAASASHSADRSAFSVESDIAFSLRDKDRLQDKETQSAGPARSERFFTYLSQAAMLACLLGLGYMAASHFLPTHSALEPPAKSVMPASQHKATNGRQEETIASLRQEVHSLKQDVDKLRKSLREDTTEMQGLKAKIARSAEAPKAEETHAQDGITAAVKMEKTAVPLPPAKPESPRTEEKKPALISSWVVRDVYQGIALVEGKKGALQVARGETIPGAGRVQSIEKRGQGWVVITNHGLVDSARD